MKTNESMKRALALILAALMILGTLGYLFSVIAHAATKTDSGITEVKYEITSGSTPLANGNTATIKVTFEVTDNIIKNNLDKQGNVVVMADDSSIEWKNGSNLTFSGSNGNYTVTLQNVQYNGKNKKLAFHIKNKGETDTYANISLEMKDSDVKINEAPTSSSSSGNSGGGSITTSSNMFVNLRAVYRGDHQTYEAGSATLNDPNIGSERSKSGYTADFDVTITDPDVDPTEIADPITGYTADQVKINAALTSGSFRYGSGATVTLKSVKALDGGEAQYTLALRHVKYTGNGNTLEINVIGKPRKDDPNTLMTEYTTRVSAAIDQCIPYNKSADDDDDDNDYSNMAMATPYVIVSKYSYGGTVTAGDTFTLDLTFYNTSRNIDVQNMMITLNMPDALMLTSSSNTFYVESLDTESSVSKKVQVTAKANAAVQSHNIEVSMKYQYIDDHTDSRKDNSTQETIAIPVVQVDRFQVTGVELSSEIYMNEETNVTVNYVNKGRSDVYNLSVEISGNIQNPGQQQNLGNLSSGSTGSADFYITPNGEGVCSGEIKITYEDTNMEEKTVTMPWSTNVVDPMAGMNPGMDGMMPGMGGMDDPGLMPEEEKKPVWPFVAGGVAAAAVVVGVLVHRRKKKRSEEEDANL